MAVYNYPGVFLSEVDMSAVVPNFSTTTAAIVGYSEQGDVDNVRLITNTQQFIQEYGTPVLGQQFHYAALAYLGMGNALYCKRVHLSALYGGAAIGATTFANYSFVAGRTSTTYPAGGDTNYPNNCFYIFAKDPGTWNNDVGVTIPLAKMTATTFVIDVWEKDIDGTYVKKESFTVSRLHQKDGYGREQYLETRINGFSQYIVVKDNSETNNPGSGLAEATLPAAQEQILPFAGGSNGSTITAGKITEGWDLFMNKREFPIRMLIQAGQVAADGVAIQQKMQNIAETRKDCIAILDIPEAQLGSASGMVTWRNSTQAIDSSYCALYAGWVKTYDQYNDTVVSLAPSGYIAAQYAYNDYVANVWYAPAGLNRGTLNVLGVTDKFSDSEIGTVYDAQINAIASYPGEGSSIWGQKTLAMTDSALSRVNVRRLMMTIETAVETFLNRFIFEPNNEATRFRVAATIDEYLAKYSAGGAFQNEGGDKGYLVVCNTSNNTTSTIDSNELHVDIYVKPSRSAEFIVVQTILTRTGASFNEIISRNFAV